MKHPLRHTVQTLAFRRRDFCFRILLSARQRSGSNFGLSCARTDRFVSDSLGWGWLTRCTQPSTWRGTMERDRCRSQTMGMFVNGATLTRETRGSPALASRPNAHRGIVCRSTVGGVAVGGCPSRNVCQVWQALAYCRASSWMSTEYALWLSVAFWGWHPSTHFAVTMRVIS